MYFSMADYFIGVKDRLYQCYINKTKVYTSFLLPSQNQLNYKRQTHRLSKIYLVLQSFVYHEYFFVKENPNGQVGPQK